MSRRSEWGYSHEMAALGLTAQTHSDAIIETDTGSVDLRFKCEKEPVSIDEMTRLHLPNER